MNEQLKSELEKEANRAYKKMEDLIFEAECLETLINDAAGREKRLQRMVFSVVTKSKMAEYEQN